MDKKYEQNFCDKKVHNISFHRLLDKLLHYDRNIKFTLEVKKDNTLAFSKFKLWNLTKSFREL